MTSDPTDVLRPLRRTRQVREFEPTPVDRATLDALADVARWTGSSRNTQPWRFIVITDPATIARDPRRRPAPDARAGDGAGGDRDRPAGRPGPGRRQCLRRRPGRRAAPDRRPDARPRRRDQLDPAGRPAGRRPRSSACPTIGWSGRSSSSATRRQAARRPKSRAGRGPAAARGRRVRRALAGGLTPALRSADNRADPAAVRGVSSAAMRTTRACDRTLPAADAR